MFKKTESIKLSKYFELVNPTYVCYQLLPHSSCRNNTSENLAKLVNKIYVSFSGRFYREEKKIFFETKSKVSYFVYVEHNKAEFYFVVPQTYKKLFQDEIRNTWKNVKLNEVKIKELPQFGKDASRYGFGYKKEDALSLSTDRRDNSLLAKTLNVMEILEEGDRVGVVYNFIPSSPFVLNSYREYHKDIIKKFRNNRSVYKNKKDMGSVFRFIFDFLRTTIEGLADELDGSSRGSAMIRDNLPFANNLIQLTTSTINKERSVICKSQIVVLSEGKSKREQDINAKSVCEGFSIIEGDNELVYNEIKKDFKITDYKFPCEVNTTSIAECSNFLQMPGRELLQQYSSINHLKVLENPVPNELQRGFFRLGEVSTNKNSTKAYKSEDKQLSRLGMVYLGSMGAGKTTFMTNNAYDIMNKGHGLIVIDIIEDCKLSRSIEAITPKDKLVVIDCSDPNTMQSFSYNELQEDGLNNYDKMARAIQQSQQLAVLLNAINDDAGRLSAKMSRYLYAAGSVVFTTKKNSSLRDVINCLSSPIKRNEYIDLLDEELLKLLEDEVDALNELTKVDREGNLTNDDNAIKGILDRVTELSSSSAHTKCAYKKDCTLNYDFTKLMEENKVVLIKIPEHEFASQSLRNVIATFYLSKIWLSKQLLSTRKQPMTYLFFDEFYKCDNCQMLFEDIFCESRKFKLVSIVALHFLNQLYPKCREALKASGSSYLLLQGADGKAYQDLRSNFMQFGYEEDDLLNLERYSALALMKTSKNYSAFITKLPLNITEFDEDGNVYVLEENMPSE